MRKLLLHTLVSSFFIFYFTSFADCQEAKTSLELTGGIGTSWFSNSTKKEFLTIHDRQFDSNIESWKSELKAGLFSSTELRIFHNGGRFRLGGVVSYSQYAIIVQSTVERESLGLIYLKEKRNGRDYKIGIGANIQYPILILSNHQLSPFLFLGLEMSLAYNIRYDQEIKFYLDEESSFNQLTQASRYRSIERAYFERVDIGLSYTYKNGRLSPFSELGFRYVGKMRDSYNNLRESWWAVYFNLGIRFNFK